MRFVWIVGGPPTAKTLLEPTLSRDRTGLDYQVRLASNVSEIPGEHLGNAGVIVLLDAFAPQNRGFGALKELREKNFKGPIFIFGEPATEEASSAFSSLGLSGFFPPFERADYCLVGGVLHSCIEYDGSIEIERFIQAGGRASSEVIKNLRDFNAFSAKFATFVSRFGVDLDRLKKVLMALSLPHIKTDTGSPTIEHPFPIFYGMDPLKIVLAAPTFSRGANLDTIRGNYAGSLAALKNDKPFPGAMFPEFSHITRATQNLIFFSGSSSSSDTLTVDPILLMTTLTFPPKDKVAAASYFFTFMHVIPTAEAAELAADVQPTAVAAAHGPTTGENETSPSDEVQAQDSAGAMAAEEPADRAPQATIPSSDEISQLLNEPKLFGDEPQIVDVPAPEANAGSGEDDMPTLSGMTFDSGSGRQSQELSGRLAEALSELEKLRKICDSMGKDIKRLMKERRQPTTDRELRDSNVKLQDQVKQLNLDKVKARELIATREKQIELLKVQMETIKKEKAA